MDSLKGYKTVMFNVLMTALMVLKMWKPDVEVPGGPDVTAGLDLIEGAMVFIWGIGNLFFRAITNTSIFKKV